MLVPRYWAEGKVRHRDASGQVTFRRFGWSNESQAEAQLMADERATEALKHYLAGETHLQSREENVGYNGTDGLPIREEILEEHGEVVITRNAYGAHCLNTPNVLFVDMDTNVKYNWDPLASNFFYGISIITSTIIYVWILLSNGLSMSWMIPYALIVGYLV